MVALPFALFQVSRIFLSTYLWASLVITGLVLMGPSTYLLRPLIFFHTRATYLRKLIFPNYISIFIWEEKSI